VDRAPSRGPREQEPDRNPVWAEAAGFSCAGYRRNWSEVYAAGTSACARPGDQTIRSVSGGEDTRSSGSRGRLLEDPWLTKSSQNDQNSGGDQTSVNVHLESLLELAPSYGE